MGLSSVPLKYLSDSMSVFYCLNYCSFYITVGLKKTQNSFFPLFFGFSFVFPFPSKFINNLSSSVKNVIFLLELHGIYRLFGGEWRALQ